MKRLIAATLWSMVGWYSGAVAAWAMDLGPGLSPILALLFAALVFTDPLGMLWRRGGSRRS